jgi:hypothetical protein
MKPIPLPVLDARLRAHVDEDMRTATDRAGARLVCHGG